MIKGIPTKEEIEAIRDSILLPFMLDMVEADLRKLQHDRQPLRLLFIAANEALSNDIFKELVDVKKFLKEREIKVIELGRYNDELRYQFWIRGYEDKITLLRYMAKSELSIRFGKRIAEVASRWK